MRERYPNPNPKLATSKEVHSVFLPFHPVERSQRHVRRAATEWAVLRRELMGLPEALALSAGPLEMRFPPSQIANAGCPRGPGAGAGGCPARCSPIINSQMRWPGFFMRATSLRARRLAVKQPSRKPETSVSDTQIESKFDLDSLLHPARAFAHPSDVVRDPDLTLNEKRAILASWASDACAVEAAPELRMSMSGNVVRWDDIMDALRTLDHEAAGAGKPLPTTSGCWPGKVRACWAGIEGAAHLWASPSPRRREPGDGPRSIKAARGQVSNPKRSADR
jgi:hypothetical protein